MSCHPDRSTEKHEQATHKEVPPEDVGGASSKEKSVGKVSMCFTRNDWLASEPRTCGRHDSKGAIRQVCSLFRAWMNLLAVHVNGMPCVLQGCVLFDLLTARVPLSYLLCYVHPCRRMIPTSQAQIVIAGLLLVPSPTNRSKAANQVSLKPCRPVNSSNQRVTDPHIRIPSAESDSGVRTHMLALLT